MKLTNVIYNNYETFLDLYLRINKKFFDNKKFKIPFFSLFIHKKLNYFIIFIKKKFYIYSNGQLLGKKSKKIKFFKKTRKSFGYTLNVLAKKTEKKINSIYYFYCQNYNVKNYFWIKKYFYLVKPTISYFYITNSWNYIMKKRRRIKKKIFRNLFKNSKVV